jgi:hypothetical protein
VKQEKKAIEPISLKKVRTVHLQERPSKVSLEMSGRPWQQGQTLKEFLQRLPRILAAADLWEVTERICTAKREGGTVLLAMGAHPIKVGVSPQIIDLMERRVLSGVAVNGAGIIHDAEMALAGRTSEDVSETLVDGSFGMSRETAEFLNTAISRQRLAGQGLGAAVGQALLQANPPHLEQSILATGAKLGLPVTVHVALGTDIIHIHPSVDPAATGAATHLDFRIFARLISTLEGGVYLNLGSAVLMPEIFLKALTLVRNLGHSVNDFTTVNMDFQRQYRPRVNVVERPTRKSGKGFEIIGHHEIMLPLLAAAIIESLG